MFREQVARIGNGAPGRTDDPARHPTLRALRSANAQELLGNGRLAATYEDAGIGLIEVDPEGRILGANGRLCDLMGYSSSEQLLGRSIFQETHPHDAGLDRRQFRRQMAGEIEHYTIEKRMKRRDGAYVWASITSSSVRDPDGKLLHAVRVYQDISTRRRAEEALARGLEEQAALHDLTRRLQHAPTPADVHEPVLDAIFRALQCHRAAILTRDATGVMRFVASRGLSEPYRRAVEGHSPWTADADDPQPICIDDAARSDLSPAIKEAVMREGIRAIAFVPFQDGGRVLGKFMAYYNAPHAFTDAEMALACTIARQLGFGLERVRSEQAARQLGSIVQWSDDAIISKDLDGIITTWNLAAERLFGYTAEEAIGKPITILIPKDRLREEAEILGRIRNGEPFDHYETIRRRKDGSLIDISLTVSPMRDSRGRIVGASKIARDITERKKAQASLRESERRLQDLLAAIPAAIYTTDAAGKITYYNQAAVELAGRIPVVGSDQWCVTWKLYRPDGTPLAPDQCPMAVALKEGRTIRNVEAVAERPDGTRVPFIPFPTPLLDDEGNIIGAINMLIDISERKQAETQQRVLLNELNHRVKNNMQTLQSLLFSAARRTRSREAKRVLEEASARVSAMAAAQRVLYGTTGATCFNVDDFLEAICQTIEQTHRDEVHIVREKATGTLSNDIAMPLALILNELLTNAVKHGLKDRDARTIRVGFTRDQNESLLYVEDDGPGFDLSVVRDRASGLGLVQGLARQLRGRFEVERNPRTRCCVRFARG